VTQNQLPQAVLESTRTEQEKSTLTVKFTTNNTFQPDSQFLCCSYTL